MHHRVLEDTLLGFSLFLLKGLLIAKCPSKTFVERGAVLRCFVIRVVILEHRYNILRLLLVKLLHPVFMAKELIDVFHALFLEHRGLLVVAFGLLMQPRPQNFFFLHALDLALLSEQGQNFAIVPPWAHVQW